MTRANDTNSSNEMTPSDKVDECEIISKIVDALPGELPHHYWEIGEIVVAAIRPYLRTTPSGQVVEKPLHIINSTGCSICGTDALHCSFWKDYRRPKQDPIASPPQPSGYVCDKHQRGSNVEGAVCSECYRDSLDAQPSGEVVDMLNGIGAELEFLHKAILASDPHRELIFRCEDMAKSISRAIAALEKGDGASYARR